MGVGPHARRDCCRSAAGPRYVRALISYGLRVRRRKVRRCIHAQRELGGSRQAVRSAAGVRILAPVVATLAIVCGMASAAEHDATKTVVFVCEHGNVKSLMAASYFNQLASQRSLPFRAVSRGAAPDSTTGPKPIVAGLHADGVDGSDFHPWKIT